MSVRQLIPECLAYIPPGPELARVLADLEPSKLSGFDCVEVLKAQYRQANHERARLMALMAEVGLCGVTPAGDELRRMPLPDEFSADEIRAALVLTRRAAEAQFWLAHDLVARLPQVHGYGSNDGNGEADDGEPDGEGLGTGEPGAGRVGDKGPDSLPTPLDWAGLGLRVGLSTLLCHDQYPAEIAGWGPVHSELARELATTLGAAQWRFVVTDEHGHPIHWGITRARPAGTPARSTSCRAIVELQVPATVLHTLKAKPDTLGGWAPIVADLARQLAHNLPNQGREDPARRAPGAVLRRYLEIRDRFCVMVGCRAPAHGTDADHTRDHACGGPTIGTNLGAACRHDHRLKGEGGWRLHQPEPGVFRWISRLGHTYHRRPPKITEPPPDPVPRDQAPYPIVIPSDDNWENTHI